MSRYPRKQARNAEDRDAKEDQASEEPRSRRRSEGFNPDYSYVRKDLKRIAALAGFFLAVLLALAFVLN
jgi:hypothetical protein